VVCAISSLEARPRTPKHTTTESIRLIVAALSTCIRTRRMIACDPFLRSWGGRESGRAFHPLCSLLHPSAIDHGAARLAPRHPGGLQTKEIKKRTEKCTEEAGRRAPAASVASRGRAKSAEKTDHRRYNLGSWCLPDSWLRGRRQSQASLPPLETTTSALRSSSWFYPGRRHCELETERGGGDGRGTTRDGSIVALALACIALPTIFRAAAFCASLMTGGERRDN
jgi:hypothetical protein